MKTCTVVYATPERQRSWRVVLDDADTVGEALRRARAAADAAPLPSEPVPWDADVGIFGELCAREAVPRDGDRIEIYRPLRSDPKESRRARAAARKVARGPAPSRPLSSPRKP